VSAWVLGIEIANPAPGTGGSLALRTPDGCVHQEPVRAATHEHDDLLPAIDRLTRAHGCAPGDLARVCVSIGPGGFTATRTACAVGKVICRATGAACVGVPSALVARWALGEHDGRVCVALAAKRESAWVAVFDGPPSEAWFSSAQAGRVMEAAELRACAPRVVVADGHLPGSMREALAGAGVPVVAPVFDGASCIGAGELCAQIDPVLLVPVYPREPEAVTLWRQRHGA
jgi:tRNA threonylcarbamoyl adenosine modification protein YeaZ